MKSQPCAAVAELMVTGPKMNSSDARIAEIKSLFQDDHVHMALIVSRDGRLLTALERSDLNDSVAPTAFAREFGTLDRRTILPSEDLAVATSKLLPEGRRRLAVVDEDGLLVGLLCLKQDGSGYCSDEGINQRRANSCTFDH